MRDMEDEDLEKLFDGYDIHELVFMNGFDDCIAGVVERHGIPGIVCYDRDKVISKLVWQGMTVDEAEEWYEFNQLGAYAGESTPCFISLVDRTDPQN